MQSNFLLILTKNNYSEGHLMLAAYRDLIYGDVYSIFLG